MGEVYQAHDRTLGRDVAIKVLPQDFAADGERRARFEREARLLAAVNHSNIASIYGLEHEDGLQFIVMELVRGRSLSHVLQRGLPPLATALDVGRQVASALEAAHRAGIVHRDLKPANVMITSDGDAKVLDFGIAKTVSPLGRGSETEAATELTRTGTTVGTVPSRAHIAFEYDYDWALAEQEYLRAIDLDPNYALAHHWYGGFLSAMSRHDEALARALRARDLDPLSLIVNTWVGLRHYFAGRYEMAIEEYLEALRLGPSFAVAHWHLTWAYEQAGRYSEALASAHRAVELTEGRAGAPLYLASLGHAFAKTGDEPAARAILSRLQSEASAQHVSAFHVAAVHAALGDLDAAFDGLDRAIDERDPWIGYMKVDPRLDPLRADPRFTELLNRVGLDP